MRTFLLKLFVFFSLFFPAFYSPFNEDYKMEYYAAFTLAYGILLIYMIFQFWKGKRDKEHIFANVFIGLLVLYNLGSIYVNYKYLHWYGEQVNNTIAFLFFWCLLIYRDCLGNNADGVINFFIGSTVVSNVLSIVYFFSGHVSFLICNNHFYFLSLPENYKEFRHYWLYSHKSDYALMLVGFIAVLIRFKDRFKKQVVWIGSLGVLLAALFLTHSWTGYGAAVMLFAGALADKIEWSKIRFKKIYTLWGGLGMLVLAAAGKILLAERNIFSLGGRLNIWKGAIREIMKTPQGWGFDFTEVLFKVTPTWSTNNAHNVFLNAMLRFSVPAGICFILLFVGIIIFSIYKSKSWLSVGMWLGFLMILNMDYSLLNYEMGMFLFVVYLVCIYKPQVKEDAMYERQQISKN